MSIIEKEIKRNTPSKMIASRKEFLALVEKRANSLTMKELASVSKKKKPDYEDEQHEHSLIVASLTKTFGKDKVPQMPVKAREEYFKSLVVRLREAKEEVASL